MILPGLSEAEQKLVNHWKATKEAGRNPFRAAEAQIRKVYVSRAGWEQDDPRRLRPQAPVKCTTCKDAGMTLPQVTLSNLHRRFARPCPDCGPEYLRARYRSNIRERWPANRKLLTEAAKPIRFDHLERALSPEAQAEAEGVLDYAFEAAKRFATDWPPGAILTFDGRPGTAKTHLAAKVYRVAWLRKRSAIFINGRQLQKMSISFSSQEDDKKLFDLTWSDVLVIDECDHIKITPDGTGHVEVYLFEVIEKRMTRGLCTVLTGNNVAKRLPQKLLSRAEAKGSLFIDMSAIPDGRPFFEGDGRWIDKI